MLAQCFRCTKIRHLCAHVYSSYAREQARIFTKKNLLVESYLMSNSLKFYKDPSFRLGDIELLVDVEVYGLKI